MFGSTEFDPSSLFSTNAQSANQALSSLLATEQKAQDDDALEKSKNSQQSVYNLGLKNDSDVANFLAARLGSQSNSTQPASVYGSSDSLVPQFLRDVASQFDKSNSTDQFTNILNNAQKQITAAVDELHAILKGENSKLQETANKLGAGLSEGLTRLGENLDPGKEVASYSRQEAAYELDAKAAFSITTQDGDTVELSFSANNQVAAFSENQNSGELNSSSTALYVSSDSQVNVSISGDIDEDELEAIQSVISQVDNIAESFFGGDTQAALANLEGFNIDQNELSSVAFDLSRTESVAVSTYTEIARLAPGYEQNPSNQSTQIDAGSLEQAAQSRSLIETIEERLESVSISISAHYAKQDDKTSFASDQEVSLDLLKSLVSIRQDSKNNQE